MVDVSDEQLSGSARRLAEELEEDGDQARGARQRPRLAARRARLRPADPDVRGSPPAVRLVLDASRHEHHRPPTASPTSCRSTACRARWPAPSPTGARRSSSTATTTRPVLVCFDRPVQYEAELVQLQEATGARIVQRTAVFGQVRLFTERRVVSWDGQSWTDRPTAAALLTALRHCAPDLDPAVAHGLLDLAVHWLSPARVGATIVVHEEGFEWASMDVATKFHAPKLSITEPPALPGAVRLAAAARPGDAGHGRRQRRVPRRRSALERRGGAQRRQRPRHAPPLGAALQLRPPHSGLVSAASGYLLSPLTNPAEPDSGTVARDAAG